MLVRHALAYPLRQIVDNAGLEASVIVEQVRDAKDPNIGYDAGNERMGDMFELGILDPVKVARVALENAVSVAALMLTTEAAVADIPERGAGPPAGAEEMMAGF